MACDMVVPLARKGLVPSKAERARGLAIPETGLAGTGSLGLVLKSIFLLIAWREHYRPALSVQ